MNNTVGILLAGGLSRRFGSPKAFAKIEGELFYERAYQALAAVCDHVVIVTRQEFLPLFPVELDCMADLPIVAGKGPLAGIYSGMAVRSADRYMVLACDMPFIGPNEALALMKLSDDSMDVAAVQTGAEKIPLFSVWNGNFSQELRGSISNDELSVFRFLQSMRVQWITSELIHGDDNIFQNLNTPIG